MSRIPWDIAEALTAGMDEVREGGGEHEETCLMQKLPESKAKLQVASKKAEVDPVAVLGSQREQLTRSLLASLDRMAVDESRRCAQALLQQALTSTGTVIAEDSFIHLKSRSSLQDW